MVFYSRSNSGPVTKTTVERPSAVAPRRLENDLGNTNNTESFSGLLSDPVLDFGVSVEHCDSTRHAIETETKQLIEANKLVREEIAKENRVGQQLHTDLSNADDEMKNNGRKATDLLQSCGLQEHLTQPLSTTLRDMMAPIVVSTTSLPTSTNGLHGENDHTTDDAKPQNEIYFQNFIDQHREAIKKGMESVKDLNQSFRRLQSQLRATEQDRQRMLQITNGMEEELAEVQMSVNESQASLDTELQRKTKLQDELNDTHSNVAKSTDLGDKMVNDLARAKERNAANEQALEHKRSDVAKECEALMKSYSLKEASSAELDNEIQEIMRALAECESLNKKKEEIRLDRQKVEDETSVLQKSEEESLRKLAAVTALEEEAEARLAQLLTEEAELDMKTMENDKLHAESVLPGQAEMAELTKENEQLVSLVDDMQGEIDAHKKTVDDALANIKEKQEATEENLKTVQAEIEVMRQTSVVARQEHEAALLALIAELQDVTTTASALEDANEAEQNRIDDLVAARAERRSKELREVNETMDREQNDLKQVRDVFLFGKEVLKKTGKEKKRILSTCSA